MLVAVIASAIAGATPEVAAMAQATDYRQWPSAYDWYLATPQNVHAKGLAGRVVLVCKVTDFGVLAHCKVREETPQGEGFGKAALKLSSKIKMRPTPKGETRWLLVPIRWGEQSPFLPPSL